MYLNGIALPKPMTYKLLDEPNQTVLRTLGNKLRVQFINYASTWELGYEKMYAEDNNILHDFFLSQYPGHTDTAPVLTIPALGVEADVFISVSERNLRHNNTLVEGYVFTLAEIDPKAA